MKPKPLPPIEYLTKLFILDPNSPSGLRWKISPSKRIKPGDFAGSRRVQDSYWRIRWKYNNKSIEYLAHRIVFALQNNYDPGELLVDHVDNDKDNNKPLRIATKLQNSQNRNGRKNTSSKYKGVSFIKPTGKWRASITINKRLKHIGVYLTEEEAALAYNKEAISQFGSFARLNNVTSPN